jgi:hypothetical protein
VRRRRLLRRLGIVLAVVVVVALAAFSWFAFWPLEGSVDHLERLVPEDVDFVYSGTLRELEANAWVRTNLLESPLLPAFADLKATVDEQLQRVRDQLEKPINDAIPLGIARFSLEEDLFPGRTILCGRFCEGWGPERNKPLHPKEWLLLTKTTWKVRFLAALKHGFVRKQAGAARIEAEDVPGLWHVEVPGVAVTRKDQRAGCSEGFIIPPENEVYLVRVKDVLGLTNSRALGSAVAELGRIGEGGRSFADRPDFALRPPTGGIAAAIDVRPLHGYLIRLLESATGESVRDLSGETRPRPAGGPLAGLLNRFLTVRALSKLNGTVQAPSPDMLRASARVLYEHSELARGVQQVYSQPPGDLRSGIARLVPAADTFGVLLLQAEPLYLMQSVWEEALTPGQRDLVVQNLRNKGTYQTMDDFFRDLSQHLDPRGAIAIGRISEVFDRADYAEWYTTDPVRNPDPFPAFAILVGLKQTATAQEVDDFLARSMPALGFKPEIQRVEYGGITYSRLEIEQKTADYMLATPAYMLVQDTLVIANNEDYFRKIVDTLAGKAPALAEDDAYRASMAVLPPAAQMGVFLDLAKVFRVPPNAEPESQPRGFLWDRRNLWVIQNKDPREEAIRLRREKEQAFHRRNQVPSAADVAEIERQVDEHVVRWQQSYPRFLEEYRQSLLEYRRLRAFAASFVTDREAITADFTLLTQPAAPAASPP